MDNLDIGLLTRLNELYGIPVGRPKRAPKSMPSHILLLKTLRDRGVKPSFRVFGTFKAAGDGAKPVIEGIAASTVTDLDSDRFAESALTDMERGLRGATAFLNHRYAFPEDILGTITRTSLVRQKDYVALAITVNVAGDNPRAVESWRIIQGGTRAGFSVGLLVLESRTLPEKALGRQVIEITRVLPLEVSLVGIPSNQISWAQAAKAARLRKAFTPQ